MVTVKDLKDWSEENGEDVVFDGPYMYNMAQYQKLGDSFTEKIFNKYNHKINDIEDIFDWYDPSVRPSGANVDDAYDLLLESFVDLINSEKLEKAW